MPRLKLTTVTLERLRPPATGQVDYFDTAYPALALRITAKGVRSWTYFGRVHGKLKRATLGRYPGMTLAEARRAASATAESMQQGVDPAAAKRAARNQDRDSFEAVAEQWLQRDQAHNRSCREVKRAIGRDVLPVWEGRRIATIVRRDVIDLVDGIADRGALTYARRVQAHLHRLFGWAVGRDIIASNPVAHLPKPGEVVKRDRVLTDAELALVWRAACTIEWPFGPLFLLLILTGARREEIGALRWSEVPDGDTIRLEGHRTKNGKLHLIALAPQAATIVKQLRRVAGSEFVFTTTGGTAVSGWSKAKSALDAAVAALNGDQALLPWRLHDLRRTMRTGMSKLGVQPHIAELAINHIKTGVEAIYDQHRYHREIRAALVIWAKHVESVVGDQPYNVVALKRSA